MNGEKKKKKMNFQLKKKKNIVYFGDEIVGCMRELGQSIWLC